LHHPPGGRWIGFPQAWGMNDLPTYLPIHPSIHLSISIYLSIYLSIYFPHEDKLQWGSPIRRHQRLAPWWYHLHLRALVFVKAHVHQCSCNEKASKKNVPRNALRICMSPNQATEHMTEAFPGWSAWLPGHVDVRRPPRMWIGKSIWEFDHALGLVVEKPHEHKEHHDTTNTMNIMTSVYTWHHMQKNASKALRVHEHMKAVLPPSLKLLIWPCTVAHFEAVNDDLRRPHMSLPQEILHLGSEIICGAPLIRHHMRGFIAKQDNTCLSRNHMPMKNIQTTHSKLCRKAQSFWDQ
jgi:hypothetical protein